MILDVLQVACSEYGRHARGPRRLVLHIFRDPGAESGVRESRNGQKKVGEEKSPCLFFADFFLLVSTFPYPAICPWVSEDGFC